MAQNTPASRRPEQILTLVSLAGSAALVVGLFLAYWTFNSQLALAQAADSFLDVFTGTVLAYALVVSAQPSDREHPFGHSRAEPIGALIVAVVAGVVAFEVIRSSVMALLAGNVPELDIRLVYVFACKSIFKLGIWSTGRLYSFRRNSPALRALMMDARNDILLSLLAITGFFVAKTGWPALDSWLAFPIGIWIAKSGYDLASDNIRLLMGEAPPSERQKELLEIAKNVEGVIDAHDLRAHSIGTVLHLHLHIQVAEDLTVRQAHDIGENVRIRLESEPDVGHAGIHIDIE